MIPSRYRGIEKTQKEINTVLDKIRAELHATAEIHEDGDYYLREEWIDEVIDNYKEYKGDKNEAFD